MGKSRWKCRRTDAELHTYESKKAVTLRSSDGRKPPIHIKHRSAGVFHIPDKTWNTSALAAFPFTLKTSSKCAVTLFTILRSSGSLACALTAVLSSLMCLLCSSNHRLYSASNAKGPAEQHNLECYLSMRKLTFWEVQSETS